MSVKKYNTFSGKEYAFVCDPVELEGLSNAQIMKRLGFTDTDVKAMLYTRKINRPALNITLIENPGNLKVPTWEYIKSELLLGSKNDAVFGKMLRDQGLINRFGSPTAKFNEYFKVLENTYPSTENINNLPAEIIDFNRLLQRRFGNNALFTGKGFTLTYDGKFGLREFILSKPKSGWDLESMAKDAGFKIKKIEVPEITE